MQDLQFLAKNSAQIGLCSVKVAVHKLFDVAARRRLDVDHKVVLVHEVSQLDREYFLISDHQRTAVHDSDRSVLLNLEVLNLAELRFQGSLVYSLLRVHNGSVVLYFFGGALVQLLHEPVVSLFVECESAFLVELDVAAVRGEICVHVL